MDTIPDDKGRVRRQIGEDVMEHRIIAQFADDCGCSVTGGDKGFTFSRCKLHAAAPGMLGALIAIEHGLTDKSGDFLAVTDILAAQARAAIEEAKK